jgi:hypothetical protein
MKLDPSELKRRNLKVAQRAIEPGFIPPRLDATYVVCGFNSGCGGRREVSVDIQSLPDRGTPRQAFPPTCCELKKIEPRPGTSTAFERWRFWCPYGMWVCADGRRVLFNRDYVPIWQRERGGLGRAADHTEWVEDIVERKRFFDGGNSPVSQFSVPSWEWRPVVEWINRLLVRWALPALRPRPRHKRVSSPRRQRLWQMRELDRQLGRVLPPTPRQLCDKHHITGKKRDYLLRGRPRFELRNIPEEERWKHLDRKMAWLAYCLDEDEVPDDEKFVLLSASRWNRHKGEWGGDAKIWRLIELASRPRRHPYGKGPNAKAPTPQGERGKRAAGAAR